MLFDSIEFAIFLPLVFIAYWLLANKGFKIQNAFLIIASYIFYGWWDWRFLTLIIFSSCVDFVLGIHLAKEVNLKHRKFLLLISVIINLGLLATFKYFDFFVENFIKTFTILGYKLDPIAINIILPVGISFYTFQTLSYTIDVYRNKIAATRDILSFFSFVSFFSQLVAGPIERASDLLPQFKKERVFRYGRVVDGLRQVLWGLFKKMVIADNCAHLVDPIFENPVNFNSSTLLLGAILFSFQIYGDFSGYSDIAIGTSRLFGFDLKSNFLFPYFSRDVAEFWRRWHISLSSWFRDYLYIPLGGSHAGPVKRIRNVLLIFIVSGFWHGASWNFIVWGFLHACYIMPLMMIKRNRKNLDELALNRHFPSVKELVQIGCTFTLITFAWIFFRAENLSDSFSYLRGIFTTPLLSPIEIIERSVIITTIPLIGLMIWIEWMARGKNHALEILVNYNKIKRWIIYLAMIFVIIVFKGERQEFIYFQF